ncbi:MAG: hypothetical protein Q8R28_22235 [Dehalococcoidia bacterium]|nr:hypothetical protein [Dehalococcoidia bacterium]
MMQRPLAIRTKRVLEIERQRDMPLEELLLDMANNEGRSIPEIARVLKTNKATVYYWLLRLGIRQESRLLRNSEVLVVQKKETP